MTRPHLLECHDRWIEEAEALNTAAGRERADRLRAQLARLEAAIYGPANMVWSGARPGSFEPITPAQWEAMTGQKL